MKTEKNSLTENKINRYFKEKTSHQLAHILWYLNYNKQKICKRLAFYGIFSFFHKDFYQIIDENRNTICKMIIDDLKTEKLIF